MRNTPDFLRDRVVPSSSYFNCGFWNKLGVEAEHDVGLVVPGEHFLTVDAKAEFGEETQGIQIVGQSNAVDAGQAEGSATVL